MLRSPFLLGSFLALTVAAVAFVVAVGALLRLTGHPLSSIVYGFLLGGAVASVLWAAWHTVTSLDGSWAWRIGAEAERWTSDALGRLGPRWRFQYNMIFYGGKIDNKTWVSDIDCVATGPGGVLAVSTKWTSDRWDLSNPTDEWLLAAAGQAARNADRLAGPLRQVVGNPPIRPVVVCWGPELKPIDGVTSKVRQNGAEVVIVYGGQSPEWLRAFDGERLTDQQNL